MTNHPDLFAALCAPFADHEVKSFDAKGRKVHYVTARTVMNRLDDVLGPEHWWARFRPVGESSILCYLTIVLPDGSRVTKSDMGGNAGMADGGDDDKSGASDALKRAAVHLGVARYLYRDGVPSFARPAPAPAPSNGRRKGRHTWGSPAPRESPASDQAHGRPSAPDRPRTGKALFGWVRDQEQRREITLLKYLNGWAKLQGFPGRMVDWSADQVAAGLAEAERKLQVIESQEPACEEALS